VPDEARQPSIFIIEMVPIHTKRLLWEMGERIIFNDAFLPVQKGFLFYEDRIFSLKKSNPILYLSGVLQ
jgi:hypothetical protein